MISRYEKTLEGITKNASLVHVYFKKLGIVKYSRDELFSATDLLGKMINIELIG